MSSAKPWMRWMLSLWLAVAAAAAAAQPDFPGRAGRIAELQGEVQVLDRDERRWTGAYLNRALSSGDRLRTGEASRATLRVGSTVLRLGADSEVELERLDDEALYVSLRLGHAALRVRSREVADEILLRTPEVRLRPLQPGHYRVDRSGELTLAGTWEGELLVDGPTAFPIARGDRREFWLERGTGTLAHRAVPMRSDSFAGWALADDAQDPALGHAGPVSPEMTGAEELQRHGRWETHPEYGAVWVPLGVSPDWAPFRDGRWAWVAPWGWTWVDAQPWAFATSHYGRWVQWGLRWVWLPGAYVARPVFAPALVAWVGGGASVSIGVRVLPGSSWVPLAPWDVWTPWFPASPRYVERIHAPWPRDRRLPPPVRPAPRPSAPPIMEGPPRHESPDPRPPAPSREWTRPSYEPPTERGASPPRRLTPEPRSGEGLVRPPRDLPEGAPAGSPRMPSLTPSPAPPPRTPPAVTPPVMSPPIVTPPAVRPPPGPTGPPEAGAPPRTRAPGRDDDAEERRKRAPEPRGPARERRQME